MQRPFVVCAAIAALSLSYSVVVANLADATQETVGRAQVRAILSRLAITPQSACAAGLTAGEVEPFFQAASEQLDTLESSMNSVDTGVDAARASLAQLVRDAESGTGSLAAVEQAQLALQAAIAARTSLENTVFAAVTASLPAEVRSKLSAIRTNQRQPVPLEFKVTLRSQSEWSTLSTASNKVTVNRSCALTAEAADVGTVANAAVDPAVSLARSRLDQSLASVKIAWTVATDPQ